MLWELSFNFCVKCEISGFYLHPVCVSSLGHFLPGGRRLWGAACAAWLLWRACLCPPSSLCAQGWLPAGSVVNRPKGWKRKGDGLPSSFGCFVSAGQSDQSSPGDTASCCHHPGSSASQANSHYWAIPTAAPLEDDEGRKPSDVNSRCLGGEGGHSSAPLPLSW